MNQISVVNPLFISESLVLLSTLLWAINSIIIAPVSLKVGAARLTLLQAAVTLIGLLIVSPFILEIKNFNQLNWSIILSFLFIVSPLIGGGSISFFSALKEIGVSRTQTISNSYPLLTTLFSIIFLGEQPTPWVVMGSIIVISGIGLISQSQSTMKNNIPAGTKILKTKGFWYAVLSALLFGVGTTVMKFLLRSGFNPFLGNLLRTPGIIIFALFVFLTEKPGISRWHLPITSWLAIIVATLFCHMVADILYLRVLQSTDASIIVPIASATPLWIAPLAVVFLKEKLNKITVIGLLLTILGIAAILY